MGTLIDVTTGYYLRPLLANLIFWVLHSKGQFFDVIEDKRSF